MRTVAEYRSYAEECRQLAETLTRPEDQKAVLLVASAWEKVAAEREQKILQEGES